MEPQRTAFAFWLLFLCVLPACSAATDTESYVVTFAPENAQQVADTYRAQGLSVQDSGAKYGYIVVQAAAAAAAAAAANDDAAGAATAALASAHEQQRLPLWYTNRQQDMAAGAAGNAAELPSFRRTATASAASAQQQTPLLAAVAGVKHVHSNVMMKLHKHQRHNHLQHASRRRLLQATAGSSGGSSSSGSSSSSIGGSSGNGDIRAALKSCPKPFVFDETIGKKTEGTPYGVKLVQADHPVMVDISERFNNNVLFCVIDTGLDKSNPEFATGSTSGCEPGTVRAITGTVHNCRHSWWEDTQSHGTHTSGIIAANRNGKGIVGVSAAGAQIYHYNIFGDSDTFDYTDAVPAWEDCINELDYRRVATKTPDMRLVISMSFGAEGDLGPVASVLKQIAAERGDDVLWVASAGNDGTNMYNYPAASPEVVSVAAADWNWQAAGFSNGNDDVEWIAPGVQILSTIPKLYAAYSSYNDQFREVSITPFSAPADSPDILSNPTPQVVAGSAAGRVQAPLADCSNAHDICKDADKKICLIQRNKDITFCRQVRNCVDGGGIAALIWNGDYQFPCLPLYGAALYEDYTCDDNGGFPIVMALSYAQGVALKMSMSDGALVTLDTGESSLAALEYLSGTSMSAPAAAGVAGLVWSAHSQCTASELRAAISASALDLGPSGRDNQNGYGGVQALAAHRYLLAHRCAAAPDGPTEPQSPSSPNPTPSPAPSPSPSPSPSPIPSPSPSPSPELSPEPAHAVDDSMAVVSGEWATLNILGNDQGSKSKSIARIIAYSRAASGANVTLTPDGMSLRYLSKPGWLGSDSLTYSIMDLRGAESTATVDITVRPGSCRNNLCSPTGTLKGKCSAGACTCAAGSGMQPTFVPNPSAELAVDTPLVPACRLPAFSPAIGNVTARVSSGSRVGLQFWLGSIRRCLAAADAESIVKTTAVQRTRCPSTNFCGMGQVCAAGVLVQLPSTKETPGKSCRAGIYKVVTRVPTSTGCYNLNLELTDRTKHSIRLLVV